MLHFCSNSRLAIPRFPLYISELHSAEVSIQSIAQYLHKAVPQHSNICHELNNNGLPIIKPGMGNGAFA